MGTPPIFLVGTQGERLRCISLSLLLRFYEPHPAMLRSTTREEFRSGPLFIFFELEYFSWFTKGPSEIFPSILYWLKNRRWLSWLKHFDSSLWIVSRNLSYLLKLDPKQMYKIQFFIDKNCISGIFKIKSLRSCSCSQSICFL